VPLVQHFAAAQNLSLPHSLPIWVTEYKNSSCYSARLKEWFAAAAQQVAVHAELLLPVEWQIQQNALQRQRQLHQLEDLWKKCFRLVGEAESAAMRPSAHEWEKNTCLDAS
jgi:hypothetical protein